MDFTAKLARLTKGSGTKKRVADRLKLSASAISNYISRKQMPAADRALALARALDVSLLWLVDDSRDEWPAPTFDNEKSPPLHELGNGSLLHELARRYRRELVELVDSVSSLKSVDWKRAADDAANAVKDGELTDYARIALHKLLNFEINFTRLKQDFDLDMYCILHHTELPGADRKLSDLDYIESGDVYDDLLPAKEIHRLQAAVSQRKDWIPPFFRKFAERYELQTWQWTRAVAEIGKSQREKVERKYRGA
jgi:transcriptional regulator with XRE-family HTH domain